MARRAGLYHFAGRRLPTLVLVPYLSHYFELAFELGIFSRCFAKVIPVFKSGKNYRPISLLPSLPKVLENLIKIRTVKFFEKLKYFTTFSKGFKKNIR